MVDGVRGRGRRHLLLPVLILSGCSVVPTFAPLRKADAIVVLGNRPPADEAGNVRPETQRRVEAGVKAFERGLAPVMVMTGGPSGKWIEAEVMRALAMKLGVPDRAILLEKRSQSTITNARYTMELLRKHLVRKELSVIVVSSPYHLARARHLFECTGAEVQLFPAEVPDSLSYKLGFTLLEYYQRVAYLFFDECAEVRGEPEHESYRGIL
jgi:uncharacterized SAM-binding protein YcdF (DUF218 family)